MRTDSHQLDLGIFVAMPKANNPESINDKKENYKVRKKNLKTKGKKKKNEIIDLAKTLLINQGVEQFSMRQLATSLNVQLAHIQYYFPKKNDLLAEIYKLQVEEDLSSLTSSVNGASTSQGKYLALIKKLIDNTKKPEYAIWFSIMAHSFHNSDTNKILVESYSNYVKLISEVIKPINRELSDQRREHIARLILAMIDGARFQTQRNCALPQGTQGIEDEIVTTALNLLAY